ncbi:virulence-associated E family protein [Aminipila terrae]|uniref:Virulence-associated protein E n=1 Tax=Aminipila terrae TaxID=2697030 RepID=A0A6P1MFQ9_9FIRM|nr:virulence-associated E family protein [Aminipila terrae]QHI72882.1 virulence-associated protein E [Aminipila terrae]
MNYDRQIKISSAGNRKSVSWPQQTLWWSEFVDKLKIPVRGTEKLEAYLALPKSKQDELKDVGGFVGGQVQGQRKAANITGRDLITLDLDNIPSEATNDVICRIESLGCGYAIYSTRKHEPVRPRLRILLPIDRTVTVDEYEPIARKIAGIIGIELCDPSTFQASRLMYWPSCCADSKYLFTCSDKPMLSADGVLSMYGDWHNMSEWPQVPGTLQSTQRLLQKQGDPTEKNGVVGAFCKIYDVYKVIDELIPGTYEPCDIGERFTFTGGSTTGGAVIYENGKFIYSHHATDPAGGRLCNAFDLVRLHKFGELDEEAKPDTPTNKLPSYTAMCQFAVSDINVTALLNAERYDNAVESFGQIPKETENWIKLLSVAPQSGNPDKTIDNIIIILENDPLLKEKLAFDEFANRGLVLGNLPWDKREERRQWTDVDDAGLRHYIEKVYRITGKEKLLDATALVAHKNTINDVKDYLNKLEWDGVKRLDTLLSDYLGAEDNKYTRAVIRKSLAAAVARVIVPGIKYDYMPIFSGPQGLGKSTFLRLLGKRWYSDSLQTFEGKEASEMVQGTWINEIGELNGLTKSETNSVKQFLSKTVDIYREAYGRRTSSFPRRCVFFGTTNDSEFLRDKTGNRRFWPVDVGINEPTKSVFSQLEDEVEQIWAEAFTVWRLGEPLYMSGEVEQEAMKQQEEHRECNSKEGLIIEFLERQIPPDWDRRNISERRLYWSGEFNRTGGETMPRDKICAVEIWCECFNGEAKFMKKSDTREINEILSTIPGWSKQKTNGRFGPYGFQRGYIKLSTF